MSENNCRGCETYKDGHCSIVPEPIVSIKNRTYQCPCQLCLVKTMCSFECDLFYDFQTTAHAVNQVMESI